ncbi:MAG: PKD domain-containing protein, partial [Methanobacteriota archaeon]
MSSNGLFGIRVLAVVIVAAFAFSFVPRLVDGPVVENVAAQSGDYVNMGTVSTVIFWNPLNIQMVEDYIVTFLVYSSLVTYDQNWEGPVNDLATSWYQEVHTNGSMTTYINITDSAYFRSIDNIDDTSYPLDARDVSYTYNLIKNNSGGTYDWYLEELSYFTPYYNDTSGRWDQVSTWCSYEKATLMDDISSTPILPRLIWGPEGENYEAKALGNMDPSDQIGSGPFVFEDWERDSWYKFKTAPNYHGAADYDAARTVSIPGVLYSVVSDTSAMCIEINTGVLDCGVLTGDLNAFNNALGKDASVNVFKAAVAENGITDIAVNAIPDVFDAGGYLNHHPALLDPFVREAIAMTLWKDYIVNDQLDGLPTLAHSVVQPGFWQADIQNIVPYDPAGAKAMLEANGWEDLDGDGWLEATAEAYGVQMGWFPDETELSGIRCQAIDTDDNYGNIATAWPGWAEDAGIQLIGTIETETTMVNKAWYAADYDIWVWHWGWGPEPIGGALSVWLTSEIEKAGDNCQMPMGPWWYGPNNYTDAPTTWNVDGEIIEYELEGPYSAFDQNISIAWKTLDVGERKIILDKLQQWIYDTHTELVPYYDLGLYGYSDYRFDNWGDWEAHNGLNVVQGLPWIWFRLEPVVDRKPVFNVPPETMYTAYEGVPEPFEIAVSDDEGSPLDVVFNYGDGDSDPVSLTGDTTKAQWANVTHTYDTAGTYTLNVSLTDGFTEDDVVRYLYREATVEVLGVLNEPATIDQVTRDPPSPVYIDQEVTWSATATDPDSGTMGTGLKFTWDWGDDTYSVETFATVPDGTPVTSEQTHSWSVPSVYEVRVSVYDEYGSEDGDHNKTTDPYSYTVILNQDPEDPVVQPIIGPVGVPVECVASSSDPDLEDLRFTWEWDDGTFDVETLTPAYAGEMLTSIVTHEWSAEGFYDVTVWVEDEAGHNVSTAVVAEITTGNLPPGAINLDWSPKPIYVGVNTTFNVSAVDAEGDAIAFTVDLGDGNTTSATTDGGITTRQYWEFHHTYELEGSYIVNITAEDAENSTTRLVTVNVIVPQENLPPEFILLSSYDAIYGEPKTIRPLEVTDVNGDEITVWYDWGDGSAMSMGD